MRSLDCARDDGIMFEMTGNIFFINLVNRSCNINNLGGVVAGGLGTSGGDFIGHGADAVFAGRGGGHHGGGRFGQRKIGEGAKVGSGGKIGVVIITDHVVTKTIIGGGSPDFGRSFGTGTGVANSIGDGVTVGIGEARGFVGGDRVTLTWGGDSQCVTGGSEGVGGKRA